MPDQDLAAAEIGIKRTRKRVDSLAIDKVVIGNRIQDFYDEYTSERTSGGEVDRRMQRYAKFRMWSDGKTAPWQDAFDIALPDLATHSLRIQDTLHNSVMTMRPCVSAVANAVKSDEDKGKLIDDLIDYQVFSENPGEKFVGDCCDAFVNDSCLTIYIPWVKEERDVIEVKRFDAIPSETLPIVHFKELLLAQFPKGDLYKRDQDGWEWEIEQDGKKSRVSFFTSKEDEVELVLRHPVTVFNGPRPTVLDWEDVLYPSRCENLQPPGPSNPLGAAQVLKLDYPQIDEIRRLRKSGFYGLLTKEELEALTNVSDGTVSKAENQEEEQQKDRLAGKSPQPVDTTASHKPLTRVMCFDRYDIDGDGLDEDVIWWMILETKTILKACYLTEMFPADPPRRPFAEASFIPVRGRRDGISLLELLEGMHDFLKQMADQTGDAGMFANMPFGFYRAGSQLKQEAIRMKPGTLYPLGDPQNDVYFPNMPGQSQAFGLNMMTIFTGLEDKLAMQSDLQFGRVPPGQASALRTTGGQQTLLSQGEARPERILRRFFMCLTEVWAQIHELNQRFLPPMKKFRIAGYTRPDQDPYQEITSREAIAGRFQFTFKANVLNSSKQALQASLQQIAQYYLNPLAIQVGAVGAEEISNLLRDIAKSWGVDPEMKGYIKPLPPEMKGPPITAELAITAIMNLQEPYGRPLEGAMGHYQALVEFAKGDAFGKLEPSSVELFGAYLQKIGMMAKQEQERQQLAMRAAMLQQGRNQGGPPAGAPDVDTQQVSNNELIDETLPSAKGGG